MSGLPAGCGHAFVMLISQQLHVRLTNGFLFWVDTFFPIVEDGGMAPPKPSRIWREMKQQ